MGSIFHGLIQFQTSKTVQFVQRGKSNTTCYLFIKVPDTQRDQPQQIVRYMQYKISTGICCARRVPSTMTKISVDGHSPRNWKGPDIFQNFSRCWANPRQS
jgi:hypothetical protein